MDQFAIEWVDRGREPQCAANPLYPEGIDVVMVDASIARGASCKAALPYPARRCGFYIVECRVCGQRIALTTAGRPDDPKSLTMPCLPKGSA